MTPLFVSFYTTDTPYGQEAAQLKTTLDQFGLEHEIIPMPSRGDWRRNTAIKPHVISDVMKRHEGRPVVWLDADARVMQRPILFDLIDCDVAAHWFSGHELLSSTVYFGGTCAAWNLVQDWIRRVDAVPGVWDQTPLQEAIESDVRLIVHKLPQSYAAIFDAKGSENPVIAQMQASRRLRKVVTL